jgi:hypothetical protein
MSHDYLFALKIKQLCLFVLSRLIKALGTQTPETRCKVHLRYKELYGKELVDVMRSECGKRPFGLALQFLGTDPLSAKCLMINAACRGVGTNEMLLFSMLCGRTNVEMELLKKKYFDMYSKDLGRVLDAELGGDLEKLVFNVLQAAEEVYDPEFHTAAKMKKDAEQLKEMGIGSLGTNEVGLFKILCASPPEYLKELNVVYADKFGYTLSKSLEKELNGHAQDAAMFMMGMKLKPYEEIAKLINSACKGLGTNEMMLTTALIRYQPVMKDVMLAHVELYSSTIEDGVKAETGKDYEAVLLAILNAVA